MFFFFLSSKVILNKFGIYLFVNKARGGWEEPRNYQHIVMSQLQETKIPQLGIQYMGFIESSISSLKKQLFDQQAEKQNDGDGTHEISFKMNELCWRNYKLSSQVIL